jgi:hypothetical protein
MDITKINFRKNRKIFAFDAKLQKWVRGETNFGRYAFPRRNLLFAGTAIILIVATSFYFSVSYYRGQSDSGAAIAEETKLLTSRIEKFMELPGGEEPTLATVTDRAKLKGQEFFAHAQDGDKVLIYAEAKKAILFRPSTGKIIEVTNLISQKRTEAAVTEPQPEMSNN